MSTSTPTTVDRGCGEYGAPIAVRQGKARFYTDFIISDFAALDNRRVGIWEKNLREGEKYRKKAKKSKVFYFTSGISCGIIVERSFRTPAPACLVSGNKPAFGASPTRYSEAGKYY